VIGHGPDRSIRHRPWASGKVAAGKATAEKAAAERDAAKKAAAKKNAAEKDDAEEIAVEKAMGLTVAHAIGHRLGGSVRCGPQAGQQRTL
jgi:membrane protein involved in colicin uptake